MLFANYGLNKILRISNAEKNERTNLCFVIQMEMMSPHSLEILTPIYRHFDPFAISVFFASWWSWLVLCLVSGGLRGEVPFRHGWAPLKEHFLQIPCWFLFFDTCQLY